MSNWAFGVHTPRELLERAQHEVRQLEQAVEAYFMSEEDGKHKIGSSANTCAGSLWNLVDWLANSTDTVTRAALARVGLMSKEAIRDHVKNSSSSLALCWELTNGYKHCELEGHTLRESQIDKADLSAPSSLPPDHILGYRFIPKIKTNDGKNLPALQVYKDALSFWDSFFKHLGL
jgi:hypothetical protein